MNESSKEQKVITSPIQRTLSALLIGLFPIALILGSMVRPDSLVQNRIGVGFVEPINNALITDSWEGLEFHIQFYADIASVLPFDLSTLGSWDTFILLIGLLLFLIIICKVCSQCFLSTMGTLTILAMVGASGIFIFMLNKDFIQFLIFFAVSLVILSRLPILGKAFIVFAVFALEFFSWRQYFAITSILFVCLFFFTNYLNFDKCNKYGAIKRIIYLAVVLFCSLTFMAMTLQAFFPTEYAEIIGMHGDERETWFETYVHSSFNSLLDVTSSSPAFLFALNTLINTVRLLFPIELFFYGMQYWVPALLMTLINGYAVYALIKGDLRDPILRIALIAYLAFIATSGSFEFDFMTWFRHLTAAFPLWLVIYREVHLLPTKNKSFASESKETLRLWPSDFLSQRG